MGELGRQPDAPDFPETALQLLTPRPNETYSLKDRYFPQVYGVVGAAVCYGLYNASRRRPVWAGIQNYFILGFGAYWAAKVFSDWRLAALAEQDAIFKNYVSLHPDEFPLYGQKRFKDLFLPWHPIR